jgi:deoxycytidylate deaminase
VIAAGYNDFAPGVARAPERDAVKETKYALTVHAEVAALLAAARAPARTVGLHAFVTGFPCAPCASALAAAALAEAGVAVRTYERVAASRA